MPPHLPPRADEREETGHPAGDPADAVARVLAVEPEEHALRRLLGTVADAVPEVDAIALVVHDGERAEIAAAVGLDDGTPDAIDGAIFRDDGERAVAPGPPLPAGTRHALAVPVALDGGRAAILAGTRRAEAPGDGARTVLRAAAARAAHALDRARLRRARDDARDTLRRAEADVETRRKALDYILGIVGHDLRNPLGAVHMSAALLQTKGGLGGWQARAVERARSSAGRMARIIADLLSYTRTRLGNGIPIHPRDAGLDAIVRRVVDELSAVNTSREIRIEVRGEARGEWDPDRLEQLASNLVSNAVDHGDGGPVLAEVDGTAADAVVLSVRNGGTPIPPDVLAHLFEPF
jgi:signal transduction histidine kinase